MSVVSSTLVNIIILIDLQLIEKPIGVANLVVFFIIIQVPYVHIFIFYTHEYFRPDLIERSRSEARIKIANVLMLLTILASLGAVLSGKAAAKRGESVQQINQDFHKQYKEDYDRKQAEAHK